MQSLTTFQKQDVSFGEWLAWDVLRCRPVLMVDLVPAIDMKVPDLVCGKTSGPEQVIKITSEVGVHLYIA